MVARDGADDESGIRKVFCQLEIERYLLFSHYLDKSNILTQFRHILIMLDALFIILISILSVVIMAVGAGYLSNEKKKVETQESPEFELTHNTDALKADAKGANLEVAKDLNNYLKEYALSRAANRPFITIGDLNEHIQMTRKLAERRNLRDNPYFDAEDIDIEWAKENLKSPYFKIDDEGCISSPAYDENSFYRGFGNKPERVLEAIYNGVKSGQTQKVFMSNKGKIGHALTYPTSGNIDTIAVISSDIEKLPEFENDVDTEIKFRGVIPPKYVKRIYMSRSLYNSVISKMVDPNDVDDGMSSISESHPEEGKSILIPVDGNMKEYDFNLLKKIAETNYLKNESNNPKVIADKTELSVTLEKDIIDFDRYSKPKDTIYSIAKKYVRNLIIVL